MSKKKEVLTVEATETPSRGKETRDSQQRGGAFKIPKASVNRSLQRRVSQAATSLRLEIPQEVIEAHREAGYHIAWCRYRINGSIDVENLRELKSNKGYEFVPASQEQVGDLAVLKSEGPDGESVITSGDCVLMRTPLEFFEEIQRKSAEKSQRITRDMQQVSGKSKFAGHGLIPEGKSEISKGAKGVANEYKASSFADDE